MPNPIRSGVCFPGFSAAATWSGTGWSADYPAANLAKLKDTRSVALRTASTAFSVDFAFPEARMVDFLALVQHNGGPAATVAVTLSSGTTPTTDIVYSSGAVALRENEGTATFSRLRPFLLPARVSVQSGRLTFSANNVPLEIGAVEIGQFWEWQDVAVDRGIGMLSRSDVTSAGDVDVFTRQWSPRSTQVNRAVVDRAEADTTLMDFQRAMGTSEPFVWVWDCIDPTTWYRQAYLARNAKLLPGEVFEYGAAKMAFDFVEHLG